MRKPVLHPRRFRGLPCTAALAAFLLSLLVPAGLLAGEVVDIRKAWRSALENHEAVLIARESLARSEMEIKRAYSKFLPTLGVEGIYTRYTEKKTTSGFLIQPDDSTRYEVRLRQYLYTGGRAMSLLRQARASLDASRKGLGDVRETVLIEASRAYYGLLKAGKEVGIREASLRRANEQLKAARARFRVGTATRADVLRAEAEVASKEAELSTAEAALKDARDLFSRVTGITGEVEADSAVQVSTVEMGVEELERLAFEKRMDYQQKKLAEDIAREQVRYAKANFMPTLDVQGVYEYREQTPETTFLLNDVTYGTVTLSIPLFEGGLKRAELKQARSRLREAELERLRYKRDVKLEVRRAYNKMEAARSVIASYRKQVTFARENYSMVFKQYRHGLADSTDLIDADTILVSAELGLTRASIDYELSVLELKRSTGILLDEVEEMLE